MRTVDANTLAALRGSRTGDGLIVWSWYGGRLAWPEPLDIAEWSLDGDEDRSWQTLSLTVADRTNRLAPWLLEDPLGTGGARLQVIYSVGGAGTINVGWFRPKRVTPDETWAAYTITEKGTITPGAAVKPDTTIAMVPMGARIPVSAYDLAAMVSEDRFIAPESPTGATPTAIGEIKRLLTDRVPVVVAAGVTDRDVNKTLIYQQQADRWQAVQDLAKSIGAAVRMNGDGQCEVYPITTAPVATLVGGPGGVQISVNQSQDTTSVPLYNIFVADGTATAADGQQVPVRGVAQITAGPLRVDGPNGRVPKFYSSTLITTQAQADDTARQMRDTQVGGLTTDVRVECLPMPHLMIGDWATLPVPLPDRRVASLSGRIVRTGLRGSRTSVERMTLTLRCDSAAVRAALGTASSNSIAGPIIR